MLHHYHPHQDHMSWTYLGSKAEDTIHTPRVPKSCPSNGDPALSPSRCSHRRGQVVPYFSYFVVRAVSFSCEELRREGSAQPANPLNPWHQFERRHIRPDRHGWPVDSVRQSPVAFIFPDASNREQTTDWRDSVLTACRRGFGKVCHGRGRGLANTAKDLPMFD